MNIAICTICTDVYWNNYPKLRTSIDKYFLTDHNVYNFVYTDFKNMNDEMFYIQHLPSPLITLMKFNFLIQKKHILKNFDLLYFIDGDCEIVTSISEEIFPTNENRIVVTKHPWQHYNSKEYEDNPNSTAYVKESGNNHYVQACFFGGYAEDVLKMSFEIHDLIKKDLKIRYIAKWFDESYMNKYILDKPIKFLDCGYAYPTKSIWGLDFNTTAKIMHDNKFSV